MTSTSTITRAVIERLANAHDIRLRQIPTTRHASAPFVRHGACLAPDGARMVVPFDSVDQASTLEPAVALGT